MWFLLRVPGKADVAALKKVPAFKDLVVYRPGYAIEYDYFDHTFCNQIVNQDTDVGLVPSQCERFATVAIDVCVDAGNDSLSACFFVTGSSVYLSGKEQVLD